MNMTKTEYTEQRGDAMIEEKFRYYENAETAEPRRGEIATKTVDDPAKPYTDLADECFDKAWIAVSKILGHADFYLVSD